MSGGEIIVLAIEVNLSLDMRKNRITSVYLHSYICQKIELVPDIP